MSSGRCVECDCELIVSCVVELEGPELRIGIAFALGDAGVLVAVALAGGAAGIPTPVPVATPSTEAAAPPFAFGGMKQNGEMNTCTGTKVVAEDMAATVAAVEAEATVELVSEGGIDGGGEMDEAIDGTKLQSIGAPRPCCASALVPIVCHTAIER